MRAAAARIRPRAAAALTVGVLAGSAAKVPCVPPGDPFAIIDPQNWVNPDNMTWADFRAPPGTNWSDPTVKGTDRNFNIALITLDYSDRPFVITQPVGSTLYGNPQPSVSGLDRESVPAFYHDLLNKPQDLNQGHTIHEYWMGDSFGRFGVDLTAFGPYRMPSLAYQYGITNDMNPGGCPPGSTCNLNIRTDALAAWRADVGNATADSFELVFILSAGQDESSTWQEFGEMRFQTKEDVPDDFGPPGDGTNYAKTRYVEWSSWAAASNIWPNAGGGSSTQGESSGMATYAHELSHLLSIGDNYNNPYGVPLLRAYTGPWSMMDRGSFNGPGGPHSRWQIPAVQGASMGSLHTVRDKAYIGLIGNSSTLSLSREALASSGPIVARLIARSVNPGDSNLLRINIAMSSDLSPPCNTTTDVLCDGGSYNNYNLEVVDRMGADSFTPDSGVHISKTKNGNSAPFQWTIDANPRDIGLIDFYRPNGTAAMITLGDYRQLADALFHAGTRSGSEFEYVDEANNLHLYVLEKRRDSTGVLSYTVAARSLQDSSNSDYGIALGNGIVAAGRQNTPTGKGVTCVFPLTNNGTYAAGAGDITHPQDVSAFVGSDIYRLAAEVEGDGWRVELPNALARVNFGSSTIATVAVGASVEAVEVAVVRLTASSESDALVTGTAECKVNKI